MKIHFKYLIIAGFFGVVICLSKSEFTYLSDVALWLSFSTYYFDNSKLYAIIQVLLPLFIFQIVYGTAIYRHFCSASVYHFTRVDNRVKWFFKEAIKLYPIALMYIFTIIIFGTITAQIKSDLIYDWYSFVLVFYYVLIYSLYLYFLTLLTNVLSIIFTSSAGFLMANIPNIIGFALFYYWQGKLFYFGNLDPSAEKIATDTILIKSNILSHLSLYFHSSDIAEINSRINICGTSFSFDLSVFLFFILSVLTIILGCLIVKRKEFIVANSETEV